MTIVCPGYSIIQIPVLYINVFFSIDMRADQRLYSKI